jgi:hypothetical protein
VFTSTDPAAGASGWQKLTLDLDTPGIGATGFTALACPSTSLCLASDGNGNIWVSTDPAAGAQAWSKERVGAPNNEIVGVACPSASLCVANDDSGDVWVSTDPASGASAWHRSTTLKGKTGPIEGFGPVHCSSPTFCWSTITNGTLYDQTSGRQVHIATQTWATTTPLTGGWTVTTVSVPTVPAADVSCPTSSFCVQVSGGAVGTATSSSGPWQTSSLVGWMPPATGVGCPVLWECVAVDQGGNVLQLASDGAAGMGEGPNVTWTATAVPGESFTGGVSCPTSSFCLAGESGGAVSVSTDPTGPVAGWRSTALPVARGSQINSVSCPSAQLCVAATSSGRVLVSAVPTAPASWHALRTLPATGDSGNPLVPQPLTFTACPSVKLCFAGAPANIDGEDDDSADSGMLLISTAPTRRGSWTGYRIGLAGLSCPATNLCVGLQETSWSSQTAALVYSRNPKGGLITWKSLTGKAANAYTASGSTLPRGAPGAPSLKGFLVNGDIQPGASQLGGSSIACASRHLCVAVGESGSKPRGGVVLVSTDPTVASSWQLKRLSKRPLVGVSCSPAGQCAAYSESGQIFLVTT